MSQTPPEINYLAKDYASFRRLMLDRLALLLPGGMDDQPADLQVALVELLAYTADQLSYYQDAVATEAYLGTARSRISLRRHARLLNYTVHEGCNARVWMYCQVDEEWDVTSDWRFLTEGANPVIFEPCHAPRLYPQHNYIEVDSCDATGATLKQPKSHCELKLKTGDLLLLETPKGEPDVPLHHVVRLTAVQPDDGDILRVTWSTDDALPSSLPIARAVARGNIVLADHGQTLDPQQIEANSRLRLPVGALTYAEPLPIEFFSPGKGILPISAVGLLNQNVRLALPQIKELSNAESSWTPCSDLLESDRTDAVFVVESEHDGSASLRFGDDIYGRCPVDPNFLIRYRIGSGRAGNVGAEAICRVEGADLRGVTVRNPLPAQGGEDPEPAEQVRIFAPQAFRIQRRAINAGDYAARTQSFRDVQHANADFRWTGSWYTAYLFVDRRNGEPVDEDFKQGLIRHLEGYQLAGYDLEIRGAIYVPLTITFTFEIKPGFTPNTVSAALKETLGKDTLSGGRRGYFHPDNWTFGQPVYLSHFYKAVLSVPGVAALDVSAFRRKDTPGDAARTQGMIEIGAHEIVSHKIHYQQDEFRVTITEAA